MISNKRTEIVDPWGISKNGELYKYHDGQFIAIEKYGNGFIISDYVEKATRRNSNIFFASFFGGVVGGAVGGGIAGALTSGSKKNRLLLVDNISHITKKKRQPEATRIDMNTGEFTF